MTTPYAASGTPDITASILEDHHQQRLGFAALDDIARDDVPALTTHWERLAHLLEVHAAAEEEHFYPSLLRRGGDDADDETEDAVGDHNDIRDAVRRAGAEEVGSEAWWAAVGDARTANSEHMGEEEREALADFRRHADASLRADLAAKFEAYKATHQGPVGSGDKDPQEYVEQQS